MRTALLIGRSCPPTWFLPQVLHRAGFLVDLITSSTTMRLSRFVRQCQLIPCREPLAPLVLTKLKEGYDWIIITEDGTLSEMTQSDLSIEQKLKILPVLREENIAHLHSKIGLSQALSKQGVKTPPFAIVRSVEEALCSAKQIGYPIMLKVDSSSGGLGVHLCHQPKDLKSLNPELFRKPLLIQKKVEGIELDLSALFLEEKLVHFSYAKIKKTCHGPFGPSSLRTYTPLSCVDQTVFEALEQVGKALGINGFTTISCMMTHQGISFFEVDVRPNVWVDMPRCFGEDPAKRIQEWFAHKKALTYPVPPTVGQADQILIPYFLRLTRFELIFNRYRCWKYIPREDPLVVLHLIALMLVNINFRYPFFKFLKLILSHKMYNRLRTFRKVLIRSSRIA